MYANQGISLNNILLSILEVIKGILEIVRLDPVLSIEILTDKISISINDKQIILDK